MENLFYQISQVLGVTLLHSLWQGLIVYLAMRLIMQLIPELSSRLKYIIAFTALVALLVWFIDTLFIQINSYTWASATPPVTGHLPANVLPIAIARAAAAPVERYYFLIAGYLPYVTALYLAGLMFNALRMLIALNNIHRIRKNVTPTGYAEQVIMLSKKIGISKYIQTSFSEYIDVPCITGVLKPIILLPITITTYLTVEEISAILLHEMAHIRRHDYLFNLIQQVIGILLFFNPFNILINRIVNREREHCCDDIVIKLTGTPLVYAQALLKLEEKHIQEWRLALTATGKKYHLLNRIERIMKTNKNRVNVRPVLIALMVLICSLSSIAWLNPKVEQGKVSVKKVSNPLRNFSLFDTTKRSVVKAGTQVAPAKKATSKKTIDANYVQDTVLERLQAELVKHAKAITDYYNSPEFAPMQADIAKQRAEVQIDNSLIKRQLQDKIDRKQADLDRLNNDTHLKLLQQQMDEASKKVRAYMTGADYAKMMEKVDKINSKMNKDNDDKKSDKYMAEIAKVMQEFTNNSKIKQTTDLAKKLDLEIKAYYNQPEYLKVKRDLKIHSDSLKFYNARTEQPERPEQPEKPEQSEPPEQPEKPEQPERAEQPERSNTNINKKGATKTREKITEQIAREKGAMKLAERELADYKSHLDQQKKQ